MRNKTFRTIVDWYDKYMGDGLWRISGHLSSEIDNDMKKLRKAHRSQDMKEIYWVYAEMVFHIVGWLWSKGWITAEDFPKNSERALLGPTHMDLLLSYVEDFVGWDLLDELMWVYMESQNKRKIVDKDWVKWVSELEVVNFDNLIEQWNQ